MSKNISEIPFTEIVEKVKTIGRVPESSKASIRSAVNEVYVRELPYKHDWNFLFASSALVTTEQYKTGTVSVNTGSTSATFSSDSTITSSMSGRKIKISGNDVVYDFTYSNSTGGMLNPPFQGASNASGNSFIIFQPTYSLAPDFERFPKDGGVYKWVGGNKEIMKEEPYNEYSQYFSSTPSTPEKVRLVGTDTAGNRQLEFRPAPNYARVYGYDYIRQIKPMSESTAGTVTIVGNSTTVTGSTSCRFTEMATGDYLRIEVCGTGDDSIWYRVATISNDSSLTLSTAYASSGVTNASFTISKVPDIPVKLHQANIWGALRIILTDQNDQNSIYAIAKYKESIDEARKLFVSRTYSQKVQTVAEEFMYRR